jgi:hypothetical protein
MPSSLNFGLCIFLAEYSFLFPLSFVDSANNAWQQSYANKPTLQARLGGILLPSLNTCTS